MGKAIGIDLGTTNSVIAILDKGNAKIVENFTSITNPKLTPSVVAIGRNGESIVGEPAKAQAPEHTIFSIKRFMGRHFRHLTSEIEKVPYEVTENSQNGEVLVWLDGKPYSPAEISALILESLKKQAEAQIGGKVTHAVITVPAYFTDRPKRATHLAGKLAGLEVMQLISEPTAAALAYGIDTESNEYQKILVYDLGGGTFDTTVFFVAAGVFTELSRVGANQLGGDDFDQAIISYMIDQTKRKYGHDLSEERNALRLLKAKAEEAKIHLSKKQKFEMVIPNIGQDHHGRAIHIDLSLTRAEYEKLIRSLVRRTIKLVEQALEEAKTTANEIDHILLVGGSSVTPLVVKSLSGLFGRQKIIKPKVHPMYSVALGAAIQSGILPKQENADKEAEENKKVVACPTCARLNLNRPECLYCQNPIGIEAVTLEIRAIPLGIQTIGDQMEIMIDKGTYYPTPEPITKPFETTSRNQTSLRVPIYEGFSDTASKNEYLGIAEGELPWGLPVGTKVDVSFSIDVNGILYVSAELQERSDVKVEAKIKLDLAPEDPSTTPTQDWPQKAQTILDQASSIFLPFGQNLLTREQIKRITNLIHQLQQSITMDDQVLGEYKAKELRETMQDIGQVGWLIYGKYRLAHPSDLRPTEKADLDYLVEQGIQANTVGDQSQLDSITLDISTLVDQIRQRIKSHAIDETGLLQRTRSLPLEEWWFPA